jgi:hypothetical protein
MTKFLLPILALVAIFAPLSKAEARHYRSYRSGYCEPRYYGRPVYYHTYHRPAYYRSYYRPVRYYRGYNHYAPRYYSSRPRFSFFVGF